MLGLFSVKRKSSASFQSSLTGDIFPLPDCLLHEHFQGFFQAPFMSVNPPIYSILILIK